MQRRDLDGIALEELGYLVESHQVVERIVERPQIGVYFLRQVTGEKPEPFPGLDCRTGQHDAADLVALIGVHGGRHREVGLPGAGGTDGEGDIVVLNLPQVLDLSRRAAVEVSFARQQRRRRIRRLPPADQLHQAKLDVIYAQAVFGLIVKVLQSPCSVLRLCRLPVQGEMLATAGDGDVEGGLDLAQILVKRTTKIGQLLVVRWSNQPVTDSFARKVSKLHSPCSASSPRRQ